jgi:acetoin utilization protein AcuB
MRVSEVMTEGVRTVTPTTPASEAWELMRRHGIHHLVVTDGSNLVGVLSDRDIGGRRGFSLRAGASVADLMTTNVVSIRRTAPIKRAASLMRGRTIGCIPVTEDQRLVGIITVSDLLDVLGRGVDRPARAERHTLSHRVPHRKVHRAFGVW